jgi:hypothetical protein
VARNKILLNVWLKPRRKLMDIKEAKAFYDGVKFAFSLVQDHGSGVRESLQESPESYRNGRHDAEMAIARWLFSDNAAPDRTADKGCSVAGMVVQIQQTKTENEMFTIKRNNIGPGWHILNEKGREVCWVFEQGYGHKPQDKKRAQMFCDLLNAQGDSQPPDEKL